MEDGWPWMVEERVRQCSHGERCSLSRPHVQTPELSRKEIDDRTHVDLLSMEGKLSEVGRPDMVRIRWHDTEQEVREVPFCLAFPIFSSMSAVGFDSVDPHDALRSFPVHA